MKNTYIAVCYAAVGLLVMLAGLFMFYYTTSQSTISQLSDNQTKLTKALDTVYTEYVKLAKPKAFANEQDLIKWLDSNTTNPSIAGYMSLAKTQGVYMEIWLGWKANNTTISGIDFGENWEKTRAGVSGIKAALITVVGQKTYIIDPETKRFVILDLVNATTDSTVTSWRK